MHGALVTMRYTRENASTKGTTSTMSTNSTTQRIQKRAAELEQQIIEWRRHFHANPEVGGQEHETSAFICSYLDEIGVEYTEEEWRALVEAQFTSGTYSPDDFYRCSIYDMSFIDNWEQ